MQTQGRNILAWGENGEECQARLNSYSVAVAGTGILAEMVLAGLAGLSIGKVYFMGSSRIGLQSISFLSPRSVYRRGTKKAGAIEKTLSAINPNIEVKGIYSEPCEAILKELKPGAVIDATNNKESKETMLRYSLNSAIPFISCSSNSQSAAVASYYKRSRISKAVSGPSLDELLLREFQDNKEGGFTSGIAAAVVCEEIRKLNFFYPDENDRLLAANRAIYYSLFSDTRNEKPEHNLQDNKILGTKKALVVGAGGIGTFVCLCLALEGIRELHIIDYDTIEDHNLNRQILFYGCVGEKKSIAIAKRLKQINPKVKIRAINGKLGIVDSEDRQWLESLYEIEKERFEESNSQEFFGYNDFVAKYYGRGIGARKEYIQKSLIAGSGYDVVFGCLDNKLARLWLNEACARTKTAYIDGGTGPKTGQIASYIPGKTKCIGCQLDLLHFPSPNHLASCAIRPEGSVVMSNMLIGSAMVGEAIAMFSGENSSHGVFRYNINNRKRFWLKKEINIDRGHYC